MFLCFISESFKRFQYFNFETNFLENKKLFQKTGVPFIETTKTENTSSPFKTALSQANVKGKKSMLKITLYICVH